MARSFNPIEHYPDRWRELKEIQAICDADIIPLQDGRVETHTLGHLWYCLDQELDNSFILSSEGHFGADEYACSRWETMLGINPSNNATLNDRQCTIAARLFMTVPYSLENIKKSLSGILREEKTNIIVDVENQTVKVIMSLSSRFKINAIKELMDNIIPANMILLMDIDHTTHEDLARHTHEELEPYTHEEITVTEL